MLLGITPKPIWNNLSGNHSNTGTQPASVAFAETLALSKLRQHEMLSLTLSLFSPELSQEGLEEAVCV